MNKNNMFIIKHRVLQKYTVGRKKNSSGLHLTSHSNQEDIF